MGDGNVCQKERPCTPLVGRTCQQYVVILQYNCMHVAVNMVNKGQVLFLYWDTDGVTCLQTHHVVTSIALCYSITFT